MSKKVSWIIIVGKNINNGKEWKKLAKKKQKNKKQIRENLETCEICWINWILYVGTQNLNNSPEFVRVVFNIISATLVLCENTWLATIYWKYLNSLNSEIEKLFLGVNNMIIFNQKETSSQTNNSTIETERRSHFTPLCLSSGKQRINNSPSHYLHERRERPPSLGCLH